MRRPEWLDRQIAEHPWRTAAALLGVLSVGYVGLRLIAWQDSIDDRRLRRRHRSVTSQGD
jgi:hypothetical protein